MQTVNRKTIFIIVLVILSIIILSAFYLWWQFSPGKRADDIPRAASINTTNLKDSPLASSLAVNLEVPWSMDFLPNGDIVFTERIKGNVHFIETTKEYNDIVILTLEDFAPEGEGGLLGIAVHPDFSKNKFIYLYYTYQSSSGLANKVQRYRFENSILSEDRIIIDQIPGSSIHNGGRIKFGPDKYLYITTGDAAQSELSQNKSSLAGKILRLEDDGRIPDSNPFKESPIYSYGHRNPQGLAWDSQGHLWSTEHGQQATDEVNQIKPGKNYGWPTIRGNERQAGLESPYLHSGLQTWAPSGTAYYNGSLFFAGLRGQSLYELKIQNDQKQLKSYLNGKFGRLRDAVVGPDGFLYILTSNKDGRGVPQAEDDQIIRINPEKL